MLRFRWIIKTSPFRTESAGRRASNTDSDWIIILAAEICALCQAFGPFALKNNTLDLPSGPRSPGQHFRECELCRGGADVSRCLIESALREAGVVIEWFSPETPEEFPDGSERFYPALGMLADRRVWGMSLGIYALWTEPWKGGLLPFCCVEGEFPAAHCDTLSKQSIKNFYDGFYAFDMTYDHF